jgi:hypothetical protein
VRPRNAL